MNWISAAALLLVVAIAVGVVVMLRRLRSGHSLPTITQTAMSAATPTDPRMRQFRFTGSNRIVDQIGRAHV